MPGDYPDFTDLVNLVGTEVALNATITGSTGILDVEVTAVDVVVGISIQSSAVTLNVAIQSSAITLNVNISSQSANLNVALAASSATVSVAIASSAVTLNVAIASSAVTLNVNISSQTGNINVALAASSATVSVAISSSAVTLNVNVSSQSSNINVNINAQAVAVILQADWSAINGTDKTAIVTGGGKSFGQSVFSTYSPSSGKTLYVCGASLAAIASDSTNGDLNQMCQIALSVSYLGYNVTIGGNGGCSLMLNKPLVCPYPYTLTYAAYAYAAHNLALQLSWWGYEL